MMKKLLLTFSLMSITMLLIISCELNETTPSQTFIYEKSATRYPWQGTNNSAYFTLPVNELTEYYIKQGVVSLALSFDNEISYQTIPATINGIAYSYTYRIGFLTVYAEDPIMQNGTRVDPLDNIVIKLTLSNSDWVQ